MIEGDVPSLLTPGAKSFPLLYTDNIQTTIHIPHPLIIREPKYLAHGNNSASSNKGSSVPLGPTPFEPCCYDSNVIVTAMVCLTFAKPELRH